MGTFFSAGVSLAVLCLLVLASVAWTVRLAREPALAAFALDRRRRIAPNARLTAWAFALGLAVGATAFGWLLHGRGEFALREILAVAVGTAAVFTAGLYDARFGYSLWVKLAGQTAAAAAMVVVGIRFSVLSVPFAGEVELGAFGALATVVWIVGVTNVINLINGLDRIAAGMLAVTAIGFGAFALVKGLAVSLLISAAVLGVTLSFLRRSWPRARAFLGDSIFQTLGFLLAAVTVESHLKTASLGLVIPALALALPLRRGRLTALWPETAAGGPTVLFVNQYFWPDMAATAQLLADLTEDATRAGQRVTVLTSRGSYVREASDPLPAEEIRRGVAIRRVRCTNFGRGSLAGRTLDYATFLLAAGLAVVFGPRHDVVVCLSTPPLVAVLGLVARLKGSRFVYKVEDLYPDVAIELDLFARDSWMARFFGRLSRSLLARADTVVALDEAMKQTLVARGARNVEVIPNWADGEAIRPDPEAGRRFREAHGLEDRFVVLYSGNLGLVHRFDKVVDAARELAGIRPEVLFLFVGAGPRLDETQRAASELPNVRFLPYQPRASLGALFNGCDLHLVSLRQRVSGLLVPCKYASALAAGKPVLLVGGNRTDIRAEIAVEEVGFTSDHDAMELARVLFDAAGDPRGLAASGRRGRRLFEAKYARRVACARWTELLSSLGPEEARTAPAAAPAGLGVEVPPAVARVLPTR